MQPIITNTTNNTFIMELPEEIKEKAKAKLVKWFDEDEMEEISEIKFQDKPKEEE